MKYILIAGCLLFAVNSGYCKDEAASASRSADGALKPKRFAGKVVETMNSGGYTYVRLDTGKEKIWAAAPQVEVKTNDAVVIDDALPMPNYHSKTLNRDFEVVYFTGNFAVNGNSGTAVANVPELPKNHPPITGSSAGTQVDVAGITKAKGGKTIEEIYAAKSKLSGQEVIVRGKVVKYNENILGKNWIHLRDGTGKAGSNDLLVTTSTPAKVGDTVLATGPIALNKDFGSNYKYDVMIENAKVVVEPSL